MVKFKMPIGLSEETEDFMKDVVKELNKRKAIQSIDLGALRMLATSYEMYLQSTQIMLKEGPIVMIKYEKAANPAQNIATKNYAQVMKIMTEYGLTVKSRSTISTMKSVEEDNSPLDKFINNSKKKKIGK
ncbi:phage terminase small subunit P27 family [Bacteroides neonati]|uniref:phage terminase small subunit P27 family n=1 Tax=Bacteroides neonati TaxID=1347393 RepID=UPI0005A91107|nr:phage terminase small subunit P27 family [Bacteroides neonati]